MSDSSSSEMELPYAKNLTHELVEEIIFKLPFPYILHSRQLSKSWGRRFQTHLENLSQGWPCFYGCLRNVKLTSFQIDFNENYAEELSLSVGFMSMSDYRTCGHLLVELVRNRQTGGYVRGYVRGLLTKIVNLLTGRKREILPPIYTSGGWSRPILSREGASAYNFTVNFEPDEGNVSPPRTYTFCSLDGTWTRLHGMDFTDSQDYYVPKVFHSGIWYFLHHRQKILEQYNMVEQNRMSRRVAISENLNFVQLVACEKSVFLVTRTFENGFHFWTVFRLLGSCDLVEVSRSEPHSRVVPPNFSFANAVAGRNRIYLCSALSVKYPEKAWNFIDIFDPETGLWRTVTQPLRNWVVEDSDSAAEHVFTASGYRPFLYEPLHGTLST